MQANEKSHPSDASLGIPPKKTTLFEAAIHCAVLTEFGPLYEELEAMAANRSNGERLLTLLQEIGKKAIDEMSLCPYPERREMIRDCYLNEMRFLAREYDAIGRKIYGPQPPIGFILLHLYTGDGGAEHKHDE